MKLAKKNTKRKTSKIKHRATARSCKGDSHIRHPKQLEHIHGQQQLHKKQYIQIQKEKITETREENGGIV